MATRYRDLQSRVPQQTGVLDDGSAAVMERLSQAFAHVESTAFNLGAGFRAEQGAKEGEAAGASGKPEFRTGFHAMTPYGRAYNSAAEVSYINGVQTDLDAQLDRIEIESEADPVGYEARARGAIKGVLDAAPPEAKIRVQQMAESRLNAGATRIAVQFDNKNKEEARGSYLASQPDRIASSLKAGKDLPPDQADAEMQRAIADDAGQLQTLVDSNAIPADVAAKLHNQFIADYDAGLSAQRIGGVVDDMMVAAEQNVELGDQMADELYNNKNYTADEKDKILTEYRERVNLLRSNRAAKYKDESAALAQSLAHNGFGAAVESKIRHLYRVGAMSPSEYEANMAASARNEEEAIGKGADIAAVQNILAGGGKLDPADKDQRKGLSQLFDGIAAQSHMAPGSEQWQNYALALAQQTNILPASAESWMRVNLLSGNPDVALPAAEFAAKVREANSAALPWNDEPKLRVLADSYYNNVVAGADPKEAYDLARKNYDLPEAQRDIREREYKQLVKDNPLVNSLEHSLNAERKSAWGYQSSLPVPMQARAEYESLVKQYYVLSGDLAQAQKLAGDVMDGMWGVSKVNGVEEIVKYPPEKNGFSTELIRKDLSTEIEKAGLKVDPAKVQLVPTAATDRTRGAAWSLGVVDENGDIDTLLDEQNRPLGYVLPYDTSFKSASDAIAADKIEQARKDRAQRDKMAAQYTEFERRATEHKPRSTLEMR